jgi:cytochrome b subunit of formate dehydrogenase
MVAPADYVVRMNLHERIQHVLLFVTFFLLVVTGFMLKIPENWILAMGSSGKTIFVWRGLVHRIAGVMMVLDCVYHLWYISATADGRSFIKSMIPTLKDGKDLLHNLAYYVGLRPHPPEFARYDYREKAEYLFLIIGSIIITITGVILWSETRWSMFVLDLSILVHGMEAIMATLAILVWHFYAVHYKPGKFPMSWIWIDGKMPLHEMAEEHPAEYERLVRAGQIDPAAAGREAAGHGAVEPPPSLGKQVFRFLFSGAVFASIGLCFILAAFLLGLLYFPPAYEAEKKSEAPSPPAAPRKLVLARYFHNVEEGFELSVARPSPCLSCHGTYTHSRSQDVRSMLNMHTYFLACETCHLRKEELTVTPGFRWFDNRTDEVVEKLEGERGVYGARLVPVIPAGDGGVRRLDLPFDEEFAGRYLKAAGQAAPDGSPGGKVPLERWLSRRPVQCKECHEKDGYLDFTRIGYSAVRAADLCNTEAAGMIEKYRQRQFFFPSMFDVDQKKR